VARKAARIYDEYLVACARAGDRKAMRRIFQDWQHKFLAHVYRLTGDAELTRDITQDGWVDIVKGIPKLKDTSVFPAWAYRIMTRRTADAIRRTQRSRRIQATYAQEPRENSTPSTQIEYFADGNPLRAAIAKLPQNQRIAIALFYTEGLSVTEISIALTVPAGTIKTRLMHARKKLRARLEGDYNG